jgi:nicotinamide-nucleotide amidase
VQIELINTGAELLVGRVLNTHQQWLCRRLSDLGYEVSRQCCVPDGSAQIQTAVRESLARAELVIMTGGLGPTSDDLTRDCIAQLLGRTLILHQPTLTWIEDFFKSRKRPMPVSTRVQALVPEGATVLPNPNGTAPGLAIPADAKGKWLILLPGPPRELRPMFTDSVVPLLLREFPLPTKFLSRNFKTTGLGESVVEEKIAPPLQTLVNQGLEIAYCARVGEVDVRLAARGPSSAALLEAGEQIVRGLLGNIIFGMDEDSLESVVIKSLAARQQTLAVAESCTGGFLAHRLTNVPGASTVFLGGAITYSNQAKQDLLGVAGETLQQHGAVSREVAREMAEGARRRLQTDYALAVTGIAGPDGGTAEKRVGTAFIALASKEGTTVQLQYNPTDRETFKFVTSQRALDLIRHALNA